MLIDDLLVLPFAPGGFSLCTAVFPSPQKPTFISKFQFNLSLREHPVFSAQVPSFTRREKPSAKTSRDKISVTSNISDQSQFTLHIPRSNSRVFSWICR